MAILRAVSRAELQSLDLRAARDFGLLTLLLMENAGRAAADWLSGRFAPMRVLVICGGGNNGGDGGVLARHLDARCFNVQVVWTAESSRMHGDAAFQHDILSKSNVPQFFVGKQFDEETLQAKLQEVDWVVDAVLGTGLARPVEGQLRRVIELMNLSQKPILSIDIPSGLDADSGQALGVAVRAKATVTFVAPKLGFSKPHGQPYLGEVIVCDIGLPGLLLKPYRVQ